MDQSARHEGGLCQQGLLWPSRLIQHAVLHHAEDKAGVPDGRGVMRWLVAGVVPCDPAEHGEELQAALREAGYPVAWNDDRGLEAVETAQPRA